MAVEEADRYPIGKFKAGDTSSSGVIATNIEEIAALPATLQAAVKGLTDQQLDTPYREGGWTVRQLVHHVADSHLNSYIRFKWTLTEEQPLIKAYEEKLWAETPDCKAPIQLSIDLLTALHARWVALLKGMSPAQFQRIFLHPDGRQLRLDFTLGLYVWHGKHHVAHVTRLREKMGW